MRKMFTSAIFQIMFLSVIMCSFPEQHMNVSEIIRYNGYPVQSYDVVTEDGYILSMQRIPHGRMRPPSLSQIPVYLQHGLMDSSATWVMNFPDQSLAFVLADAGFDVWLGNNRGNTYSNKHVKYSVEDIEFWDFSFDEMAKYDLPAMIDLILNVTKSKQLNYIAHSQGTMLGFIEFGRNLSVAAKVKTFYALAPVAYIGHIKGLLKYMAMIEPELDILFKLFGVKQFLPNDWLIKLTADKICERSLLLKLCDIFILSMCGYSVENFNETRIPVYFDHTPAGTSVKNAVHFAQNIHSNQFKMYDYGLLGNLKVYNQLHAPAYNVSLMTTPIAVFMAENDWLADMYDVNKFLLPQLNHIVYSKEIAGWNHLDFVWAVNAKERVYKDIIRLMRNL